MCIFFEYGVDTSRKKEVILAALHTDDKISWLRRTREQPPIFNAAKIRAVFKVGFCSMRDIFVTKANNVNFFKYGEDI